MSLWGFFFRKVKLFRYVTLTIPSVGRNFQFPFFLSRKGWGEIRLHLVVNTVLMIFIFDYLLDFLFTDFPLAAWVLPFQPGIAGYIF